MTNDGMWVAPGSDPREEIPAGRGEKAVLAEYLDRHRMTLEMKCEGLSPEQLARRSVAPSSMSLLGMVRHLARVEHHWTRRVLEGHADLPRIYRTEDDADLDFSGAIADADVVADAWKTWRGEVEHARTVYAGLTMDALVDVRGQQVEVRDVIVHLVEEYARHMGHADLLREAIDGRTGE